MINSIQQKLCKSVLEELNPVDSPLLERLAHY